VEAMREILRDASFDQSAKCARQIAHGDVKHVSRCEERPLAEGERDVL
tara:strand:+ start:1995 stop:2138 length:144 start_codon:yes stop_codon:yes gene_type:complete